MGLINQDDYTAQNGVTLSNTYVTLGTDTVRFNVERDATYSASTTMAIYKDADSYTQGLQPLESRHVLYAVPDASPVYQLLYSSAKQSEQWANTVDYNAQASST